MSYVHTVQRVIPASPAEVFDLLATPARHTELDGGGTVQGAVDGPARLEAGSRFGMANRRGPVTYRSGNTVVEFEEGRRIAWRTAQEAGGHLVFGGQVWRYELTDRGDGTTLVRESWDITGARPRVLLQRVAAPTTRAMSATLDRMAARFAG